MIKITGFTTAYNAISKLNYKVYFNNALAYFKGGSSELLKVGQTIIGTIAEYLSKLSIAKETDVQLYAFFNGYWKARVEVGLIQTDKSVVFNTTRIEEHYKEYLKVLPATLAEELTAKTGYQIEVLFPHGYAEDAKGICGDYISYELLGCWLIDIGEPVI